MPHRVTKLRPEVLRRLGRSRDNPGAVVNGPDDKIDRACPDCAASVGDEHAGLNRLLGEAVWNPATRRWEHPDN